MKQIAALVLFLLLALPFSRKAEAQTQASVPIAGAWSGSLAVGGTQLPLVFHFAPKPDGTLTATFDSPAQGATGIAFNLATITGRAVHLEAAAIGGSFDGTVDASGKTLAGRWMQGGQSLPLTLTFGAPTISLARPQEPKPPFPYTVRLVSFPGGASGVTLSGTLTLPAGAGPFPAAALISGSGPNDRDETILGHKPFLLLADTLTRRGIAVLRYDKRGIGKSTGSYARATSSDFARDAQAAAAYLRHQPEIDPKRIGLLGHSEGGLIAPMVAAEHPGEIAFLVLLAAPGMDGERILLAQSALIARADGATDAEVAQSAALDRELFAIAKQSGTEAAVQQKAQAAVLRAVARLSAADKAQIGDPVIYANAQSRRVAAPWFRYFLAYDPVPTLKRVRCPVLALDGSKDLQVPPAEDLAAIAQALKSGGNTDVTVKEFPGLNHLFQDSKTGSPSEYAQIAETMSPTALAAIGSWISAETKPDAPAK